MAILENYNQIRNAVDDIARSAGREPDEISIIAVSKTFPESRIQEAIDAGISLFGENKVQEAKRKIPNLKGDCSFHMIGHLQSNKAKDAVKLFDVIHSIDKAGTAAKINEEAAKLEKIQKILVQVNASGEHSKSGVSPDECVNLLDELSEYNNIEILGLMTMAPFTDDKAAIRSAFRNTRNLLNEANTRLGWNLRELSMGMSSDYTIAVEEGSTMVRVGTAIFGQRDYT